MSGRRWLRGSIPPAEEMLEILVAGESVPELTTREGVEVVQEHQLVLAWLEYEDVSIFVLAALLRVLEEMLVTQWLFVSAYSRIDRHYELLVPCRMHSKPEALLGFRVQVVRDSATREQPHGSDWPRLGDLRHEDGAAKQQSHAAVLVCVELLQVPHRRENQDPGSGCPKLFAKLSPSPSLAVSGAVAQFFEYHCFFLTE